MSWGWDSKKEDTWGWSIPSGSDTKKDDSSSWAFSTSNGTSSNSGSFFEPGGGGSGDAFSPFARAPQWGEVLPKQWGDPAPGMFDHLSSQPNQSSSWAWGQSESSKSHLWQRVGGGSGGGGWGGGRSAPAPQPAQAQVRVTYTVEESQGSSYAPQLSRPGAQNSTYGRK